MECLGISKSEPVHALETLACDRLQKLSEAERQALRSAVEAEEEKRLLLHRTAPDAGPAPHPIALTPFVIPRRLVPGLRDLARAAHRFQATAPDLYRRGVLNFRQICALDETEAAWLLRFHRRSRPGDLMIRLDAGLTADERPVLYETNSTALAGLFNHTTGVDILRRAVFPRLLSSRELRGLHDPPDLLGLAFQWVTETAERLRLQPRRRLGVAFIEPDGPLDGYSEIPQIARYFERRGVRAARGEPNQLLLTDRGVFLGSMPVDLVYREVAFADLGKPPTSGRRLAGLIRVLARQAVIPGFSGEFDHKGLLECFTSEAYRRFFSARELTTLRRCVPWTRVVSERKTEGPDGGQIDLPGFARTARDRLLIKPNRGSGGEGIVGGAEMAASDWDRALERALGENGCWVVQERVAPVQRPMAYLQDGRIRSGPCYFSLGLFYVRDHLGLHCRISRSQVVNVASGGALACVFLAEA